MPNAAMEKVHEIVVDMIKEVGPQGAPAGPMYLVFMQAGWSLEQFQYMMDQLVESGRVTRHGHVYFAAAA